MSAAEASCLLGMSYFTYMQYRNGTRPLQLYHQRHIEAVLLLSRSALSSLKQEILK